MKDELYYVIIVVRSIIFCNLWIECCLKVGNKIIDCIVDLYGNFMSCIYGWFIKYIDDNVFVLVMENSCYRVDKILIGEIEYIFE